MAKPFPPQQVIYQAASAGGLMHVSVFLGAALDQAFGVPAALARPHAPIVIPVVRGPRRADIAKCAGDGLVSCISCLRRVALDAGPEQQWTAPAIKDRTCGCMPARSGTAHCTRPGSNSDSNWVTADDHGIDLHEAQRRTTSGSPRPLTRCSTACSLATAWRFPNASPIDLAVEARVELAVKLSKNICSALSF